GATDCGEYRQAAGLATKDLGVDQQTNQVKKNEPGNNGCHKDKRPRQPLGKNTLDRRAPVYSERFFVNRHAVLILDPSVVSPAPLVRNNLKRAIRIVGLGFDYPSGHGTPAKRYWNTAGQSEL